MNILDHKLIAIIRGVGENDILQVVQALVDGGISLIEIPLNHSSENTKAESIAIIKKVHETFGTRIYLGAGTVLSEEEVELAVSAGAEYIISPNVDIKVIRKTKELGKMSMPGALTPSEVVIAYENGADIVKIFPAGNFGESYIKALKGPLGHIPYAAVGGVNLENASGLLKAGYSLVAVGGNLIDKQAVRARDFSKICKLAQEYTKAVYE